MPRFMTLLIATALSALLMGCSAISNATGNMTMGGFLSIFGLAFVFWPVVIIGFIAMSAYLEEVDENSVGFVVCFLLYLGFIQLSDKVDFIGFAKESTLMFIVYLLAYLAIGIGWSFIKLRLYAKDLSERYETEKRDWLSVQGNTEEGWLRKKYSYETDNKYFVQAKIKIIKWMMYWPFSMFWFILRDPIKRLFEFIFKTLKRSYRAVFESSTKNITDDFKKYQEMQNSKEKS